MNKYLLIIKQLQENELLSAKNLAACVHCSDRSIRNYIQEINAFKHIIASSTKGYNIINEDIEDVISNFANIDVKDRELYIMNSLLISSNGIAKYELQEKLFVSDQTIDTYIKNINKQIKDKKLRVVRRKGFLHMQGEEVCKRKLFKENLRINNYDMIEKELNLLCKAKKIDYQVIRNTLIDVLKKNQIHINDYSLLNILTHLTVKILRINTNEIISFEQKELDKNRFSSQVKCSEEICKSLENKLRIHFSDEEVNALSLLIITKSDTTFIVSPLDHEITNFVTSTLIKIDGHYGIDLYDTEFINFFSLHLKNLLKRVKFDNYNANPLFEQVLNFNSLVYDIAVFVTSELKNEFKINIPKEEIAFLAFHIGSIVVKKNLLDEDIYVAIELFDFYQFAYILKEKLIENLPNYVHIDLLTENTTLLDSFSYDLTISTNINKNSFHPSKQSLFISPIFTEQDINKVKDTINQIKTQKKHYRIQAYFEQFFNYNLFEKNIYFTNSKEYITYMSQKLFKNHLVCKDFCQSVKKREKITPTSFENGVAIPHALNCSAIRNCAYVIINDKPTLWGDYYVNIIVLIGINKNDQHEFKFLYDNLLNKLNDKNFLKKSLICKDYKDFLDFISET